MKSGALGPQRPAIVTGPLERRPGLTLALAVSNGRNSAHSTQPARRTNLAAGFFAATPGELRPTEVADDRGVAHRRDRGYRAATREGSRGWRRPLDPWRTAP